MSRFGRDEGGAALIEAALVLPILLLLLFGLMEFSLYAWNAALASKAVQLGVRRAIVSDPVALGPGLDSRDGTSWQGLPPGARCATTAATNPCPNFAIRCTAATSCRCLRGACGYRFSQERLEPILAAMQAVLPALRAENIEISYSTNGSGYVARPGPVPVDVGLSLVGFHYRPLLLGDLLGRAILLNASAMLPGESLAARR